MTTSDPVSGFTAELAQLRERAEQVQQHIQDASATVRSPDGAATVTVGPSGALLDLSFGNRAYQRPPAALAALVLQLIGTAQQRVGGQVAAAFQGLVGENSSAMELLREFLPESTEETDDQNEPEEPPQPSPPPSPAAPPQAQQPPRTRPRPKQDDDEDDFTDPW